MTEMPERIFAWMYTGGFNRGEWLGQKSDTADIEYVRADLAALSSVAVAEREPVAWRARHSEQENWYLHPSPVGWWECRPLYLDPPPTSELEAENARLRERVAELEKAIFSVQVLAVSSAACWHQKELENVLTKIEQVARRVREGGKVE